MLSTMKTTTKLSPKLRPNTASANTIASGTAKLREQKMTWPPSAADADLTQCSRLPGRGKAQTARPRCAKDSGRDSSDL